MKLPALSSTSFLGLNPGEWKKVEAEPNLLPDVRRPLLFGFVHYYSLSFKVRKTGVEVGNMSLLQKSEGEEIKHHTLRVGDTTSGPEELTLPALSPQKAVTVVIGSMTSDYSEQSRLLIGQFKLGVLLTPENSC